MRPLLRALLVAWLAVCASGAFAHEMSMAEIELREISRGEFLWQWTVSNDRTGVNDLAAVWPEGCQADGNAVHCGDAGLTGTLSFDGVGRSYSAVLVRVHWLDSDTRVYTLTPSQPNVRLYGSAD